MKQPGYPPPGYSQQPGYPPPGYPQQAYPPQYLAPGSASRLPSATTHCAALTGYPPPAPPPGWPRPSDVPPPPTGDLADGAAARLAVSLPTSATPASAESQFAASLRIGAC